MKRDVHQFRPLGWFIRFLPVSLIFLTLLLAAPVRVAAQAPSGSDDNPAAKGDEKSPEEKPSEEVKAPDVEKALDEAKLPAVSKSQIATTSKTTDAVARWALDGIKA